MQKALRWHYYFNRLLRTKRFRRIAQPTTGLSAQPSNESDTSAPSTACSSIAVCQVVNLEPFKSPRSHHKVITKSSKKSLKNPRRCPQSRLCASWLLFGFKSLSRTKFSFASSNTKTPKTIARQDPWSSYPIRHRHCRLFFRDQAVLQVYSWYLYPRALARNIVEPCLFVHKQPDQVGELQVAVLRDW